MKTVYFYDYRINISKNENEQDQNFLNLIHTYISGNELVIKEKGTSYIYSKIRIDDGKLIITNICSLGFSYENKELFFKLHKAAPIEHISYEKDEKRKRYKFYNTVKLDKRIVRGFRSFKIDLPIAIGNLYSNSSLSVLCGEEVGEVLIIDKTGSRDFIINKEISSYIIEDDKLKADFIVPHLRRDFANAVEETDIELTDDTFFKNNKIELGKDMQILTSESGNKAILLQDLNLDIRNLLVGRLEYNHMTSKLFVQDYYYCALTIKNSIISFYGSNFYPEGFIESLFSGESKNIEIYSRRIESKDLRIIESSDSIKIVNEQSPKDSLAHIYVQDENEIRIYTKNCTLEISKDSIVFSED